MGSDEGKRQERRDLLKAVAITVVTVAVIAALVIGIQQLGLR